MIEINQDTAALAEKFVNEHYTSPTRRDYMLIEAAMRTALIDLLKQQLANELS